MKLGLALFAGMALFLGLATPAFAQDAEDGPGPNANIVRWAEGAYRYLGDNGKRERGIERFRMMAHPDGSRTLMMWHDLYARDLQYSVILRVAENFRPLQAFANYWTSTGYKGSTFITIDGDTLHAISNGPVGRTEQTIPVPEGLSIGTHPVSGDGWHMWHTDPDVDGIQQTGAVYGLEASTDLSKPPLGALAQMPMEVLGTETVTVPAGTFETTHYRMAGRTSVWVTGPDRMVVRMENSSRGLSYELIEVRRGSNKD